MALATGPGIFAARLGDDFVFLDVAADAYFCVLGKTRCAGTLGFLDPLDNVQTAALIATGLLVDTAPLPSLPLYVSQVRWRDLPRLVPPPALGLRDWIALIAAHRAARRLLAGDSLLPALSAARRLPTNQLGSTRESLGLAVARFEAMAVWLPRRGECLAHSLTLMLFLSHNGFATEWVFGVHLFPFRAHCWLASGDDVVGDATHRVLAFVPIMTVGAGAT